MYSRRKWGIGSAVALGSILWILWSLLPLKADEPKPGLNQRIPWTSSRLIGSPDPPSPYKVECAFPHLRFHQPVVLTNAPGSRRLFVAEQSGKIYSFDNEPDARQLDLMIDLKEVRPKMSAVYGLTFHPNFAQNGFVYLCYVTENQDPDGTRVSRFEVTPSVPPRIDPATEKLLITWVAGGHNGGCLKFGPDGYLYISTGDAEGPSPPDPLLTGQDVSDLPGSILRIDVDPGDGNAAYRIPPDNPLRDVPGARPEIWAYGFRNPWKMSFDHETNSLWVGDVGWELWEMIYRVERGGNYGWSIMEGRQPVMPEQEPGPTPILPPTIDHPHSEAASITGGFVYRGGALDELVGAYIYGDFQSGLVWGARMKDDQVVWKEELAKTPLQLVGFGEDDAQELYLLDYQGQIFRLIENLEKDTSRDFPTQLSETGLFTDVEGYRLAPGVIPYSINAEQWADFTDAERCLAVPGAGQVTIDDKGNWQFPDGSVVAKTISIEMIAGEPDSRHRLETQILQREAGSWRPYTYVWNQDQTDARLAEAEGFSRVLEIQDAQAPAGTREQTHRFFSRQECLLCHNPWVEARTTIFGFQSASLLGMSTAQLNREHNYELANSNQLHTLQHIGVLDERVAIDAATRFADPYDESADLTRRARAYLHVNCAHCHQFNAGGAATIALAHDVQLDQARMIDVRPSQGTFGIADARIVAPGDPLRSMLFYRASKLGGGRMPRVGSREVDRAGIWMLHDWIATLEAASSADTERTDSLASQIQAELRKLSPDVPQATREAALAQLTSSTRAALALLRFFDRERPDPEIQAEIVAFTKSHAAVEVRDLFERFVPVSQRVQRLGNVVNHAEILSLEADAERGKQVFFRDAAAGCKNCHRVGQVGETLGPDLTKVGQKYRPDQLLQQILEPSQFMEPKYVPYLVETVDGRVVVGLLESQTDQEITLRDAKNAVHRLTSDAVELLVRQQRSLMPDLLLRDMTRQEVADLLAYLASQK